MDSVMHEFTGSLLGKSCKRRNDEEGKGPAYSHLPSFAHQGLDLEKRIPSFLMANGRSFAVTGDDHRFLPEH